MMKYILLVYQDEAKWGAMTASTRSAFEDACQANEQDLVQRQHLIDIHKLQKATGLTLRIFNGSTSLSDDPVARGREQLIQLLVIQAIDFNAAIQIASQLPQARGGPIEVRQIME